MHELSIDCIRRASKNAFISTDVKIIDAETDAIHRTTSVCGGEARIRNTRIPVWLLESLRRQGATDDGLLAVYPGLQSSDLVAAWDYVRHHHDEIEHDISSQDSED